MSYHRLQRSLGSTNLHQRRCAAGHKIIQIWVMSWAAVTAPERSYSRILGGNSQQPPWCPNGPFKQHHFCRVSPLIHGPNFLLCWLYFPLKRGWRCEAHSHRQHHQASGWKGCNVKNGEMKWISLLLFETLVWGLNPGNSYNSHSNLTKGTLPESWTHCWANRV